MRLKNLNILSILLLGIFLMTIGCEKWEVGDRFISQPPELAYSIDSVFANERRAKELLWHAYNTLPFGLPTVTSFGLRRAAYGGFEGGIYSGYWNWTDYSGSPGGKNIWQRGVENPASVNAYMDRNLEWEGIREAWLFIENLHRVPDMQESPEKLKAEAKMIIATQYAEMFRTMGGILWVNRAYAPVDDTNLERLTVMQSVDTITSLIDEAMQHLPLTIDYDQWSGRFTKGGALALKVKMLSFAAAPLFNSDEPYMPQSHEAVAKHLVWTGGYNRDLWVRLRDASKELIDLIDAHPFYGMLNTGNPRQDYEHAYYNRWEGETILSHRKFYWSAYNDWRQSPAVIRAMGWSGTASPMHNLNEKFPMMNGMHIDNPDSGYDPANPFHNRDPRLHEVAYVNNQPGYQGRTCELWVGGRERRSLRQAQTAFGYRLRKWNMDTGGGRYPNTHRREIQWPYFRVPEVYLVYAEALNELNGGPTEEALMYANKTRERVGVGCILGFIGKDNLSDVTKEEFLAAILNERNLEFAYEGNRLFDMQRHKLVDAYGAINYALDTYLIDGAEPPDGDWRNVDFSEHDQYFIYEINETDVASFDAWQTNFNPRTFLFPFPFDEVQKGFGLVPNPGWEIE